MEKHGCKINTAIPLTKLEVQQGSLWGTSPKTALKTMSFELAQVNSGTHVNATSALSKAYVRFTAVGCVFAVTVMLLCAWIRADLVSISSGQRDTAWSWLVTSETHININGASTLANLAGYSAIFLAVVLVIEAVIVLYVHRNVDCVSEEIMQAF